VSVERLVVEHAVGVLTVAQTLINEEVADVETNLVTEADVMGRNGTRLPGYLSAARGEHDSVNGCGVVLK